ncbi:MAG: MATE family efflux transporter [Treponema sp.]|jgi:putative MATE family efflux protein|nr:MATE family efflux transporter [Treponema sp.]
MEKEISSKSGRRAGPDFLTGGSPWRRILVFAVPLLAGDFFQIFYTIVDTFLLGRLLGINALAAAGASTGIVHFVFGFVFGLTGGFSVIAAQRFGAGNEEGIRRSIAASLCLCLAAGIIITGLAIPFVRPLLVLMRTPAEILDNASSYVIIIMAGLMVTVCYNMLASIIRAAGDSFSPLVFLVIGTILNIILDIVCIAVLRWGVPGAAAATVFSQLISAILIVRFIIKRYPHLFPRRGEWLQSRSELGAHLSLGIAMALQQSIVEVGNLLVQAAMNGLGALTIAAVSAAQRIRAVNMMPFFALARAMTTYTAQNYGAKKMDRVYRGIRQSCLIVIILGIFIALLNRFAGNQFAGLFLRGNAEALAMARRYIHYTGYTVFILGIMLVFRSSLQGLGRKRAPVLCGIMETAMSILSALALIPAYGFTGICLVNPLSWFASGIPLYIAFALFVRAQKNPVPRRGHE